MPFLYKYVSNSSEFFIAHERSYSGKIESPPPEGTCLGHGQHRHKNTRAEMNQPGGSEAYSDPLASAVQSALEFVQNFIDLILPGPLIDAV